MNTRTPIQPIQWAIVVLASATSLIHLVLGIAQLGGGEPLLPVSFILNGLGYLGLVIALYFLPQFSQRRDLLRWALMALAAVTIALYFVFNGMDGFRSPVGLLTKTIELLLIVLLLIDRRNP